MWAIREATLEYAIGILGHTKTILKTSAFMLTTPEEFKQTPEQQKEWLLEQKKAGNLILVAEAEGQIIGPLNVQRPVKLRHRHITWFGISIQEAYCNQGIGTKMIEHMLEWTKVNGIGKIYLLVMATNERTIHVYEKLGFKEEGRFQKQLKFEDRTYVDDVMMSLLLH